MGTGSFPGVRCGRGVTLTPHPFLVPRSKIEYSYISTLPKGLCGLRKGGTYLIRLARSQYPEGPATGHLDTGFSWFPCVYKRMLRWFSSFQVATTCLSCSYPDLNFLVTFFSFHICVHVIQPLPPGDNPIAVNKYYY